MINKIICFIFGHSYRKAVYINNKYDVYICPRCGKKVFFVKNNNIRYTNDY